MSNTPHPWNQDLWRRLTARPDQLAHALLLAGPAGVGKHAFALELAHFLLCEAPFDGKPCGRCQNCQLYRAGTHPDLHIVQTEELTETNDDLAARYARRYLPVRKGETKKYSGEIRVDQVRALIEAQQTHAHISRRKIVIFCAAERLNVNAANSLLKLLEEPAADTIFLLVSANPARMAATIRSRCNPVSFTIPPAQVARAWLAKRLPDGAELDLLLELAGGAPLTAAAWQTEGFLERRHLLLAEVAGLALGTHEPVACAARWVSTGLAGNLGWLQGWMADLIRVRMVGQPPRLFNPDACELLHKLGKQLKSSQLYALFEAVCDAKSRLGSALDEGLLAEDILIRWTNVVRPNGIPTRT